MNPDFEHIAFLACMVASVTATEVIKLDGRWEVSLDAGNPWGAVDTRVIADTIALPGILTAQGFGEEPSFQSKWTGDGWRYPELFKEWQDPQQFKIPFFLQPPRLYVGPPWYGRRIEIPAGWRGGVVQLHLERVHWQSTVWLDGRKIGACNSLGTPHEFDLGELAPGGHHLVVGVDNRLVPVNPGPLSHSVTDHTPENWNGIVGRMELRHRPHSRLLGLQVFPTNDGRVRAHVRGRVASGVRDAAEDPASRQLRASILRYLGGDGFRPAAEMDAGALRRLIAEPAPPQVPGSRG